MDQKTYHHGDLKNALIQSALELLNDTGVDRLSLREVAKRAGVSANAPYRHFQDKEALLAAIAEAGFRELGTRFRKAEGRNPTEHLLAMGREYLEFAVEHQAEYTVMFQRQTGFEPYPDLCEASGEALYYFLEAIRSVRPAGTTQTQAMPIAIAVWSMIHGFITLKMDGAFSMVTEEIIPEMDLMVKSLILGWP